MSETGEAVSAASTDLPGIARRMWWALEPLHAVTYFAPEVRDSLEGAGLRGFWMGYFAVRSAPMGPVGPAVVDALFYNFNPAMVRRALPEAWARATPEAVQSVRLHAIDEALARIFGDDLRTPDMAIAAQVARKAAEAADCGGRALAAAHQALDWPTIPHLALWHAATVLREHRGDGHVASLVAEEVDGLEANVLSVASGASTAELLQQSRRWSTDDWERASERLVERRLLTSSGALTEQGTALKERIERATDRLAAGPYGALGDEERSRLVEITERLARHLADAGAMPFPNPIGLPRPTAAQADEPDPEEPSTSSSTASTSSP